MKHRKPNGKSKTAALAAAFRKHGEVAGLKLHGDGLLDIDALLVHFTSPEAAAAIARDGFIYGVANADDLGMTRRGGSTEPGFNFAFVADDYPHLWGDQYSTEFMVGEGADDEGRYGVVIFRAEAVHTYHWDDMWQAIFWGPDARPERMMAFTATYEYAGENMILSRMDGEEVGGLQEAIDLAEASIPCISRPRSRLPWPDLAIAFNPDNVRSGTNPYLPLAYQPGALATLAGRIDLKESLAAVGIGLAGDPFRPKLCSNALSWTIQDDPERHLSLIVASDEIGISVMVGPPDFGPRHEQVVAVSLPEDMNADGVASALASLMEKAFGITPDRADKAELDGSHLMEDKEDEEEQEHEFLYHGTTSSLLPGILREGLDPGSFWGTYRMAEYWAYQGLDDREGEEPVIICVPIARFDAGAIKPDLEMSRDPVFEEDADDDRWRSSAQDWRACLACYDAVKYDKRMTVTQDDIELGSHHAPADPADAEEDSPEP